MACTQVRYAGGSAALHVRQAPRRYANAGGNAEHAAGQIGDTVRPEFHIGVPLFCVLVAAAKVSYNSGRDEQVHR